ncbi:molybdopterin-dependent oxidoreductase [Bacillus horti]|uniref:Anaerobic selenocysteine-containing dehydrogenase n=1 Tax=Caldalkalibacillus horti TaxID=77523 RepID=A0ABT9W1I7_9BACI|nr:molybdopterin-dependent oxidoreductase [Bacillus horti]MDQ0167121.1 anaerobic selenocysteine-containing dehydrogenase [Bacillus horti]
MSVVQHTERSRGSEAEIDKQQKQQKHKTACPLNCWDVCGFEVTTADGKVKKVEGDSAHPITQGKICGKGVMLADRANHPDRLLYPLKKVDGQFERISWEQALDEIATAMQKVKKEYGSTAVLHSHDYSNGGLLKNLDQRFFNAYGGITELVGSLCWGAGIEAQMVDFGSAYSHDPDDLKNSQTIVVWGRNVTATNMHLYPYIQKAKKRGAKLIVIDPLATGITRIADQHVKVRPGMDGVLALIIIKKLVEQGLQAEDFLKHHTHGYEEFLKQVIEPLSLDQAIEWTEVPEEVINELVHAFSVGRPTCTLLGLGLQRYSNGGNTIRAIDALVAISGNIGIPGGGANYAHLGVGRSFNTTALAHSERKQAGRTFTRMTQADEVLEARNPSIKMLFVTRGNPLVQVPDASKTYQAFSQIETKVVIDQFMTDTAKVADYVLPCTTVFEEEDIYYASMFHSFVTYGKQVVEPYGEAKSDREIWTLLAERLGFGDEFAYTVEEFLEMGIPSLAEQGITLERLKQETTVKLQLEPVPWKDFRFETPSGKFEFHSIKLEEEKREPMIQLMLPEESRWSRPELASRYPYSLLSIHPQRSLHSQHFHLVQALQSPRIEVSEYIARQEGLTDGDQIEIFNDRGVFRGRVKIVVGTHPTTINVDEGRWQEFGGTINQLTPNTISDVGLGSTLYDCLVGIRKLG